jgi:endonuclease YncB( thermonuclease family)
MTYRCPRSVGPGAHLWALALHLAFALTLGLALLTPTASRAAEMTGRVVGVIDGDTIDVLMPGFQVVRVRLAGIDAPERGQAFGTAAKAALSELVVARQVVVQWKKRDRYERLVGKVTVSGADANLAMLSRGMAWHYVRFEAEQERADRAAYAQAEREARVQRRGLWGDPKQVAPWDYRKSHSPGHD